MKGNGALMNACCCPVPGACPLPFRAPGHNFRIVNINTALFSLPNPCGGCAALDGSAESFLNGELKFQFFVGGGFCTWWQITPTFKLPYQDIPCGWVSTTFGKSSPHVSGADNYGWQIGLAPTFWYINPRIDDAIGNASQYSTYLFKKFGGATPEGVYTLDLQGGGCGAYIYTGGSLTVEEY